MFVALLPAGCNYRFASDCEEKWEPPRVSLSLSPEIDSRLQARGVSFLFFPFSSFSLPGFHPRRKEGWQIAKGGGGGGVEKREPQLVALNFKRDTR